MRYQDDGPIGYYFEEVEIGQTYPIFGMITAILSHNDAEVLLEINQNIHAHVQLSEPDKLDLLRQRAFETGIFVSKILSTEPIIKVDCRTIIFGRPQGHHA